MTAAGTDTQIVLADGAELNVADIYDTLAAAAQLNAVETAAGDGAGGGSAGGFGFQSVFSATTLEGLNAIGAMELSQMCVQAVWDSDSPLRQLPGFTPELIKKCQAAGVESVYDLLELEDTDRDKLLQMDNRSLKALANFANHIPAIEVTYEIEDKDDLSAGEPIVVNVQLEREVDEDEEVDITVVAPFFPQKNLTEQYCECSFTCSLRYRLPTC